MEKKCEIVQDLIPLVADQIASEASREMVEEHIKGCEECNKVYAMVTHPMEVTDCEENLEEKKVIVKVAKKQRRRILIGIAAGILITLLIIYVYDWMNRGITAFTSVDIGSSQQFSSEDLDEAKDAVLEYFRKEFGGCKLLSLSYDETWSKEYISGSTYDTPNTIVFNSSFYVYPWGGDGSLDQNSTYDNWVWIVQYTTELNRWVVITWGY